MAGEIVPANATLEAVPVQQDAILRHLKLDPRDPATQALVLVCERYGLDPVLKHMVLIQGTPYITRDGLLHVAHRTGLLDGIEIVDQDETPSHWTATVAVYRKDMSRPITYPGRYPKSGSNKTYGPEMAIKVAEVMALRRAFDVTGLAVAEEAWGNDQPARPEPTPAQLEPGHDPAADDGMPRTADDWVRWGRANGVTIDQAKAATRLATWGDVARAPYDRRARVYALAEDDQ